MQDTPFQLTSVDNEPHDMQGVDTHMPTRGMDAAKAASADTRKWCQRAVAGGSASGVLCSTTGRGWVSKASRQEHHSTTTQAAGLMKGMAVVTQGKGLLHTWLRPQHHSRSAWAVHWAVPGRHQLSTVPRLVGWYRRYRRTKCLSNKDDDSRATTQTALLAGTNKPKQHTANTSAPSQGLHMPCHTPTQPTPTN